MLVVVQYWQQHIQVRQQVPEPAFRREAHAEVRAVAPLGEARIQRVPLDLDSVAEGLEQVPDEVSSFPGWHRWDPGLQRDGRLRQLRALPAIARQGAAEYGGNRHAQVG